MIEVARVDFGRTAFPPIWLLRSVMETNVTELARIGEDQRALSLIQDEMIVFARSEIARFDMRLTGHAEMDAEPVFTGKLEQHLLSASCRSHKLLANEFLKRARIRAAKHVLAFVEANIDNFTAAADVPLFAIPFDFGQLGHGAGYMIELGRQWRAELRDAGEKGSQELAPPLSGTCATC